MRKTLAFLLSLCLLCSPGWARVDFDGTDDYGTMTETGMPAASSAMSFFAVVRSDVTTGEAIFAQSDRSNVCTVEGALLMGNLSPGVMAMAKIDSTSTAKRYYIVTGNTFSAGDIVAVAATMSANATTTAKIRMSVNGAAGTEASGSTLWYSGCGYSDTSNNKRIGAEKNGSGNGLYFDGAIYEFAQWNTTLTSAELTQLTDSWVKGVAKQIQPSNLVLYFQLNESENGTAMDGLTSPDMGPDASPNTITWDDGANNTGMSAIAEGAMSYQ